MIVMIKKVFFCFLVIIIGKVTFAQNACPTIAMSGSSVSCYGQSDGTATVSIIAGGSGNYTYTWSESTISSGPSGSTITSLPVGTYTVTIIDNVSGCSVIGAFVVDSPEPITISESISDVDCYNDQSGEIDITVQGGVGPYTYNWSDNSTQEDLVNASAGNHTVTVFAPNSSCQFSKSFFIEQPGAELSGSGIVSNALCFGTATGAIDVTVWGGTPPYYYSWDNGSLSQDIIDLSSGNYVLTVTDVKGCTIDIPFSINQPQAITGSISMDSVDCYGTATGSISYQVSGGTLPISYSWQNTTTLFSQSQPAIYNMMADVYTVIATDDNGCEITDGINLLEPSELVASTTSQNVLCYGENTGSIDLTISGGIAPYSTIWTINPSTIIDTSEDIDSLFYGMYDVNITDENGCSIIINQEIIQPSVPVSILAEVTDVTCFNQATGEIDLTITGGTFPYTFNWSNGTVNEDAINLVAGSYSYIVLDDNLCSLSGVELVDEPLELIVTNQVTNVDCHGESTGAINLTVSGGLQPYTYNWSNSLYQLSNTTQNLENFPQDSYHYEVIDDNGCVKSDSLAILQSPDLVSFITGENILCYEGDNGSIDLTVNGGIGNYSFLWSNLGVTEDLNGLTAGFYQVDVIDSLGCTLSDSIILTQPLDSLQFSYDVFDVLCNNGVDGEINLFVNGGTSPYYYNWSSGDSLSNITGLTSGYYQFIVTDENNCIITDSIFVSQPDAVTLNENISNVTCFGFSDGIIDITPIGGTGPYEFTWYNSEFALSAQTEDLIAWPADTYQLELVDSNNCFYEMFLEITQPDLLEISFSYNNISCAGGSDGNILVDIIGGTPDYSTTWSNGLVTEDLSNINSGSYQLTVIDSQLCTDSIIVDLVQPDPIEILFEVDEVSCIDNHDGVAYASPIGGNGDYSYSWSNGSDESINTNLSNETYVLVVTDILGCLGEDSIFIPKNSSLCINPVNTFSPNSDNYNDTWVIDNMDLYPDSDLKIYNKWGNLIHQQKGIYSPWDGKTNGEILPSDTYYWILNLNYPEREVLKGNIIIVK